MGDMQVMARACFCEIDGRLAGGMQFGVAGAVLGCAVWAAV